MLKTKFKYYIIIWAVLVLIFNVLVFVTPNEIAGMSKFGGSFWIGYAFIMASFIGQLGVAWMAIKDGDLTKLFYNIPLFTISCVSLIAMLIAGTLCMVIPNFPRWLGVIICMLILLFEVIAITQAQAASSIVSDIDKKVKIQTFFIKSLTLDVDSLLARASTQEISAELKKVYDAVRFSDPMSSDALSSVESQITIKVSELTDSVEKGDVEEIKNLCKEIVILINDRNKRCKLLK